MKLTNAIKYKISLIFLCTFFLTSCLPEGEILECSDETGKEKSFECSSANSIENPSVGASSFCVQNTNDRITCNASNATRAYINRKCNDTGTDYSYVSECNIEQCSSGHSLENNSCVAKPISSNQKLYILGDTRNIHLPFVQDISIKEVGSSIGSNVILTNSGKLLNWGWMNLEGIDSVQSGSGILSLAVSESGAGMAALKQDGSAFSWGQSSISYQQIKAKLSSGVVKLYSNSESSAFAALKENGSVITWGGGGYGNTGADSSLVANELTSGVTRIKPGKSAFAAFKNDGSAVTWGSIDSSSVKAQLSSGVADIQFANYAAAALKTNGDVIIWGDARYGGDSSLALSPLTNVNKVISGNYAFVALKNDGSVISWGQDFRGGKMDSSIASHLTSDVVDIYSTEDSLAALKSNGDLYIWGGSYKPGDNGVQYSASLAFKNVEKIYTSGNSYLIIQKNGNLQYWGDINDYNCSDFTSVAQEIAVGVKEVYLSSNLCLIKNKNNEYAVWGDDNVNLENLKTIDSSLITKVHSIDRGFGFETSDNKFVTIGKNEPLLGFKNYQNNIKPELSSIANTAYASAFLYKDGSLEVTGQSSFGGDLSKVQSSLNVGVKKITNTSNTFGALTKAGAVQVWGSDTFEPYTSAVKDQINSNVKDLFSLNSGYAALMNNNSVITWGYDLYAGSDNPLIPFADTASGPLNNIREIFQNNYAFAAIRNDSSVVTWGNLASADISAVTSELSQGVIDIIPAKHNSFAALKSNGSVISWGLSIEDGTFVNSGAISVNSTAGAFCALKSDGTVVTWGMETLGGDSSTLNTKLVGVTKVFSNMAAFAALRSDGTVITWGDPTNGGDSTSVSSSLRNVTNIYATDYSFVAVKEDGSLVAWGRYPNSINPNLEYTHLVTNASSSLFTDSNGKIHQIIGQASPFIDNIDLNINSSTIIPIKNKATYIIKE